MILVVVLWIVSLMTVIVVALSAFSQKGVSLASLETDRLRTELGLQAAVDVAAAMILSRTPADRAFFDGASVTVDTGIGAMVEIAIQDAAGLVDINRADKELIGSLAARLDSGDGAIENLAQGIVKIREERQPKKPDAEQSGQANETDQRENAPPVPAAFFSVAQLYALPGSQPEAVDKLMPFISLYSIDGKVNPLAAPDTVIQSVPGLNPSELTRLAAARQLRQASNPSLQAIMGQHERFLAAGESRTFVIESRVIEGNGMIAGSHQRATILINGGSDPPFHVLSWSW